MFVGVVIREKVVVPPARITMIYGALSEDVWLWRYSAANMAPRHEKFFIAFSETRANSKMVIKNFQKKISLGVAKIFMPGSHVPVTVSPKPYYLNERSLYICDPLRRLNKFVSYPFTYNHSYKKLHGRCSTHAHDFRFSYLVHISSVVLIHERPFSGHDPLEPNLLFSKCIIPSPSHQRF